MDGVLEPLRRKYLEDPTQENERLLRVAYLRAGRREEAGLKIYDIVTLTEKSAIRRVDGRWANGELLGRIAGSNGGNLYFIRPFLRNTKPPEKADLVEYIFQYPHEIWLLEPGSR